MKTACLLLGTAITLFGQPGSEHAAGLQQYSAKNYAGAAESFQKALQTEAVDSAAYRESTLFLGQSLYLLGRTEEAVAALKRAPRTIEALYMLGNGYLKLRDLPNCVASFAEMFGLPPGSAAAHLIAGQMMIRQELLDDGQKEIERALALDPNIPQGHYLLGELLTFKGETDQAIVQLRAEIALNPASAMAYYKLGDAYSRQTRWELAIPLLQKSVWLNSTNSGPYILLGKGYLQQKQLSNAEGVLRRAVQMDPNNSSAHYLLGQTLIQEGHMEEGRSMLQLSQKLK